MRTVLRSTLTLVICVAIGFTCLAQTDSSSKKNLEIGLEIQAYPTGILLGLRLEKYMNSNSSLNLRLALQFIDHRDLGVHENEEGSGYGASLAYRRFFKPDHKGLSLALRTDLWFNEIEWQDKLVNGISKITVVQPTIMGEYSIQINPSMVITPSLSFGWEWNVSTDGEPTGEGAIILIGCTVGFGM
jgi:hypothetical protein